MYGSWVLLVILFISSIPIIAVYIWLRIVKYDFSLVWFLLVLLTGAAAFFPALVFQELLSFFNVTQNRSALFFEFFIRVALTEELSRLLVLLIFFWISKKVSKTILVKPDEGLEQPLAISVIKKGTATGLIAGLGFSILESARYAASSIDISVLLLRFFTAALHGACGSRIGAAIVMFPGSPAKALLRIITATAIHGVYNFLVAIPGIPSIAAFFIAISAFIPAILSIRDTPGNTPLTNS